MSLASDTMETPAREYRLGTKEWGMNNTHEVLGIGAVSIEGIFRSAWPRVRSICPAKIQFRIIGF